MNAVSEDINFREKGIWDKTLTILEMVKFPHTIFALPTAVMSAFVAAKGVPGWQKVVWIILAMVGARNAGMAFNRIADMRIDAENPRTKNRALPKKILSPGQVWVFVTTCSLLFLVSAYFLNHLAFTLAPWFLVILFSYSYTKRFTRFSHVVLGLCLGLAPVGAWIGVRGSFELIPAVLGLAVLTWTAGFDIIYACQDADFDRQAGLCSIPAKLGIKRALGLSALFHMVMFTLLVWVKYLAGLGAVYNIGLVIVGLTLIYEHWIVRPDDLSKVDFAFCTLNGIISVTLLVTTLVDILV